MNIVEVKDRTNVLVEQLLKVWESSVRATHLFLSNEEIENIKKYVPQALKEISYLILFNDESNRPIGFMGINHQMLEMLFIAAKNRGHGIGKQLLNDGVEKFNINELAVNEQNPQAKGFYEHMGFKVYKRTELDEQGKPYPLLYMRREI